LEIGDGIFEVKATNGDTFWVVMILIKKLSDWILDEFPKRKWS
jgi:hypothetical protein